MKNRIEKSRPYLIDPRDISGFIRAGQQFFESHPNFFPEPGHCNPDAYSEDAVWEEANILEKNLNQGAKAMIARGGVLPPYLCDIQHLLEKLVLILNRNNKFYTHDNLLAHGDFDLVTDGDLRLRHWLALRSVLVPRFVGESGIIKEDSPVAVSDLIYIAFSGAGNSPLGWNTSGTSLAEFGHDMRGEKKKLEGLVRRLYRLGEVAGRLAKEVRFQTTGCLSIINETRTDNGLSAGRMPSFFSDRVSFGHLEYEQPESISLGINSVKDDLLAVVIAESRGNFNKEVLRGGRLGLRPSFVYR